MNANNLIHGLYFNLICESQSIHGLNIQMFIKYLLNTLFYITMCYSYSSSETLSKQR